MAANTAQDPKTRIVAPPGEEGGFLREMKALINGHADAQDRSLAGLSQMEREAASKFRRDANLYSVEQSLKDMSATDMIQSVAAYQGMDFVDLSAMELNHDEIRTLIRELGPEVVRTYRVLPLRRLADGTLEVAIADPLDVTIADNLRMLTDKQIKTVVASEEGILDLIEMIWGVGDTDLQTVLKDAGDAAGASLEDVATDTAVDLASDVETLGSQRPVIGLVNAFLLQTIKDHASDLHIEPFRGTVRVRYRVDGVLRELPNPPKHLQMGLVSRLKVLAKMDIAEQRKPQDGRIRLTVDGREVDLRVSTLPTVHGESVVMRILDKAMMMLSVDQLGLSPNQLGAFNDVIHRPNGIMLVCGPTGCGKTTTLYAALGAVNDPAVKIITTEDPVEYQLPGLVQVNINQAIGLTFASCLRSILRQDPDMILVGEIRDVETAEIAIQAALTGHMVFSTVHANSAAACATRLIDMGVEPFLITSTMQAILSQRLIRTLCRNCAESYTPTDEELSDFGLTRDKIRDDWRFQIGAGCDECGHHGYRGRLGIFEMLLFDEDIRDMILERATSDEIHVAAVQRGMETMRMDGWNKIINGITTFEEVARQTPKESAAVIRKEMRQAMAPREQLTHEPGAAGPARARLFAPWEDEAAVKPRA